MGAEGNRALLNFGVRIHEISKCKCTYAHVKIMCVNEIEAMYEAKRKRKS